MPINVHHSSILYPTMQVYITGKLFRTDSQVVFRASSSDSPNSHTFVRVEGYAAYHYGSSEGWPCAVHAESSTFSAMFALLLWEIIFSPGVADVFRTPYQVKQACPASTEKLSASILTHGSYNGTPLKGHP